MSLVQDQKKIKWVVLSSRPKKIKMSCLEFKTKENENELSWVQDRKKKMSCLEFKTKKNENELSWVQDQKKLKWVVFSSRPKKK